MVVAKEIKRVMREGKLAMRIKKGWITCDGLVQQIDRLEVSRFTARWRQKNIFGARVEIERGDVACLWAFDGALFAWRKLCLQLIGNCPGNLALNGENIGKVAIVGLGPKMRVGARIDQLRVYPHTIGRALHAAFHHMRYPKLLADLAQVTCKSALILHHGSAADDFQVRDLCQVGEDFVLYAVGEVFVLLFLA